MKFNIRKSFIIILLIILIANIAIILEIPYLKEIFGFVLLTLLPGLLICQSMKMKKLDWAEKIVIIVGLSISFILCIGLSLNTILPLMGVIKPLSKTFILTTFDFIIILMFIYNIYKKNFGSFRISLNINSYEKLMIILLNILFILSIYGSYVMMAYDNNLFLLIYYAFLSLFIILICSLYDKKKIFPKILPFLIFWISFSTLLIMVIRFPHIIGHDVHFEYYFFQTTLENLKWQPTGDSILDATLTMSLLPTIYQVLINFTDQEVFFKLLTVIITSFSPLGVYVLSKRYVNGIYAFVAAIFFMSQLIFLAAVGNPRTVVAVFFIILAILSLFNPQISAWKSRLLFIIFTLTAVVSHYTSSFIFFSITLFGWIFYETSYFISKRFISKDKSSKLTMGFNILFFTFIFLWCAIITTTSFNLGIDFIVEVFKQMFNLTVTKSSGTEFSSLFGQNLAYPIISILNVISKWLTFLFIGIGLLFAFFIRYGHPTLGNISKNFNNIIDRISMRLNLSELNFEDEYLALSLVSVVILLLTFVIPYLSVGYDIQRINYLVMIFLAVFLPLGGLIIGKLIKVKPYKVLLLILIPTLLFNTGFIYEISGAHTSMVISSQSEGYNNEVFRDSEVLGVKWLKSYYSKDLVIYGDAYSVLILSSQGQISPNRVDYSSFKLNRFSSGYIYLRFANINENSISFSRGAVKTQNMTYYIETLNKVDKLYDNGGSNVYYT